MKTADFTKMSTVVSVVGADWLIAPRGVLAASPTGPARGLILYWPVDLRAVCLYLAIYTSCWLTKSIYVLGADYAKGTSINPVGLGSLSTIIMYD